MGKIVWTELLRDDLENIFTFIAEDSKTYAAILL
jgi:plasmid stabilization system protein ParE